MPISIDNNWISNNIHYFINKNVVIITGAGISVPSGIPDFRSKTGIFRDIKDKYKIKGENLFSYKFSLDESTRQIYLEYIHELKTIVDRSKPTDTHRFFKWYVKKSNKLRVYTQNIDGLEEKGGLDKDKLVYLHGNLKNLKCLYCGFTTEFTDKLHKNFKSNLECMKCSETSNGRLKRIKRYLHTNIVHYHQDHPESDFISECIEFDSDCNLFIVVGTSMSVFGVRNMIKYFTKLKSNRNNCILVNLDKCGSEMTKRFDYFYKGTADAFFNSVKSSIEDYELDISIQDISIHEEDASKQDIIQEIPSNKDENLILSKDKNLILSKDKNLILSKDKNLILSKDKNLILSKDKNLILSKDKNLILSKDENLFKKMKRHSLTKDEIVNNFLRLFEE
ncbi:hypothetical protein P3W45_001456 [Vairimorpha bombi]|jgi:NAD+-dependent protein deacetylase SIR2